MSHHITPSECFTELSDWQQEQLAGGADFELSGTNFANRIAALQGLTTSGPNGSTANSSGQTSAVNTAAQDLLGLGVAELPTGLGGALGPAPVLTGLAVPPTTGIGVPGIPGV